MARPAFGYLNKAGDKVPGVTTVLKNVSTMDTDILCNWAARMAREGRDWRNVRRDAGKHGSLLHDLCEKRLPHDLGVADRPPEVNEDDWYKLQLSYKAIADWYVKHEPKIIYAEEPLVSEEYQFAGTPDAVWNLTKDVAPWKAGAQVLGDYKTGKMIGPKEVAQMAAYRQLLRENDIASVEGCILIHAPTARPGFMNPVVLDKTALDLGWLIFTAALEVEKALPPLREVFA